MLDENNSHYTHLLQIEVLLSTVPANYASGHFAVMFMGYPTLTDCCIAFKLKLEKKVEMYKIGACSKCKIRIYMCNAVMQNELIVVSAVSSIYILHLIGNCWF